MTALPPDRAAEARFAEDPPSDPSASTAVTSVYILRPKPLRRLKAASAAGAARVRNGEFERGELVPGTRYRVLGLLGSGGMGTVYEVEHTELGKRFVLKMLLSDLALREDLVARLRNEQRALGRLEHPSIVAVTDAGVTTANVPYFVMERLDGETLGARLKRTGCLPLGEAITIAAAVLDGLAVAHEIGVVHRDIKPQNIFLASGQGAAGVRPKILDFGVAKIADTGGAITARGVAVGTPRYMSPEQARGESVDGRSDLYAIGLLLYECAVGTGPFDDARDANEMLLAHLSRPVPRLSQRLGSVTRDLDELVLSLLAKEPGQRPPSAREAAQRLRAVGLPYTEAAANVQHALTVRLGPVEHVPTTHADGVAARQAWGLREGATHDAKTLARVDGALGTHDTLIDDGGARGFMPVTGDVSTLRDPTGGGPITRTELLSAVDPPWPGETRTRVPVTPTDGSRTLDPVPAPALVKHPDRRWWLALAGVGLLAFLGAFWLVRAIGEAVGAPGAASAAARDAVPLPMRRVVAAKPALGPDPPPAAVASVALERPAAASAPASPTAPRVPVAAPSGVAPAPVLAAVAAPVSPEKPKKKARVAPRTPKIPDGLPSSGL